LGGGKGKGRETSRAPHRKPKEKIAVRIGEPNYEKVRHARKKQGNQDKEGRSAFSDRRGEKAKGKLSKQKRRRRARRKPFLAVEGSPLYRAQGNFSGGTAMVGREGRGAKPGSRAK